MNTKQLHLALIFLILCLSNRAISQNPKENWEKYKLVEQSGFSKEKLASAKSYYDSLNSSAFLIIQNGKVVESGKSVVIPDNTIVIDLNGNYIYPSFIDPYSSFGIPKTKRVKWENGPQYESKREGFYWNDHVMPENRAIDRFEYDRKKAGELRKAGFGVINTHIMDGIARGTGILVTLNDRLNNSERIINDSSGQYFSFKN